jgi:hypothetical protein
MSTQTIAARPNISGTLYCSYSAGENRFKTSRLVLSQSLRMAHATTATPTVR